MGNVAQKKPTKKCPSLVYILVPIVVPMTPFYPKAFRQFYLGDVFMCKIIDD